MKMRATGHTRSINRSQGLEKSLLSEILALLPIAGQAVDCMEHQRAIFMNERLYCLSRGDHLHRLSSFRVRQSTLSILHEHLVILVEMREHRDCDNNSKKTFSMMNILEGLEKCKSAVEESDIS